jgi:hypothetical protein
MDAQQSIHQSALMVTLRYAFRSFHVQIGCLFESKLVGTVGTRAARVQPERSRICPSLLFPLLRVVQYEAQSRLELMWSPRVGRCEQHIFLMSYDAPTF